MSKIMLPNCKMIRVCDIVKKTIEQLCEFGIKGEKREFHYYNVHNEKRTTYLTDIEKLHRTKHCQRCGVRIVIKDKRDGYILECLSCGYHASSVLPIPLKNQIEDLERELYGLLEKANNTKALLETMKRHNNVVEKNLQNKAMEEKERND
jgi:DNA-directed RNA polymerase subunit RPC12/RpoP